MGIDPGFALIGWSVIESDKSSNRLVDFGCVETDKVMPFNLRLELIYKEIVALMRTHRPEAFVMEELFFNTNQKTVINVAQARGVLVLAAVHNSIPLYEYTPLQIKMALTGYGRADKQQVQRMVQKLFKLKEIPKPDDAADALAVAYCHSVNS